MMEPGLDPAPFLFGRGVARGARSARRVSGCPASLSVAWATVC